MMKAAVLMFTTGAVLLAGGQGDDVVKKETAKLHGTWKITRLDTPNGQKDDVVDATLTFKEGGMLEFDKGGEMKKGSFKINPAAKPKEIEITPDDNANKVMRGIY